MTFGGMEYGKMRRKLYYAKLIMVRPEDITQERSRLEKYGKRVFGGQLRKRMRMTIVDSAIYVSGPDNPHKEIGCHISQYYLFSHFKNGDLTLSDLWN